MSQLVVMRHGQASFLSDNYDQLSELGKKQARLLGSFWAEQGYRWDKIIVGPKQRQKQSYEQFALAYAAAGISLPDAVEDADFNEHRASAVVRSTMKAQGYEDDPRLSREDRIKHYMRHYQRLSYQWVAGELVVPEYEHFQAFRKRVTDGLLRARSFRGNIAVFSSGGPVAVSVGEALQLSDQQVIELSWLVRNGAFASYLFSQDRLSLQSFNEASFFSKELQTLI